MWKKERSDYRVLVACEHSDAVRWRFAAFGFDAWSCDLKPSDNPMAKHYTCDLFDVIGYGWDMMIAFPPCTDLASSGCAHFSKKIASGQQQRSVDFFMRIAEYPIMYKCIENPVGIMSSIYRKPDQIVHPYYFGDPVRKRTCLWLTNLPKLVHNSLPSLFYDAPMHTEPEIVTVVSKKTGRKRTFSKWEEELSRQHKVRSEKRSLTFPGIAQAMADQWSKVLL